MKQYKIKLPDNVMMPYQFLKASEGDICNGYVTTDHGGTMIILTNLTDRGDVIVPCGYVREYIDPVKRCMGIPIDQLI
jgi:hypothetical protein